MNARRAARGAMMAALLLLAQEAAAQGVFDFFGDDRPSHSYYSERARAAARERRREDSRAAARKREATKRREQDKLKTSTAGGAEPPPPPYEPQLTRLTEILGALSFLRDLCGAGDGDEWRGKMSALLDADAPSGQRREKLTASFNRGFRGFELTYRVCTPNAEQAITRYLAEAGRLTREITYRYGNP